MKKVTVLLEVLMVLLLFVSGVLAQGVPAPYTLRLQPFISSGLSAPVFMTSARDGTNRLFIVQQGGIIRVLQPGSTTPSDFLNITTRVLSGGERGLLGLAFHPQYTSNRRFFVYYTRQTDGAIQIAEYHTSPGDPNVADTTEKIIITIPHPTNSNHNGGTVAFGPDGYLYAATGDGGSGNDPPNNAQNINILLGKFIRLDINVPDTQVPAYNIPPTNPYAGATPGADEIYTIGMRNPYRFSFDRGGRNALWAADVGQNSWEEVDTITLGGNYGWRIYEGNHCTNLDPCVLPANYVPPVFEYSSSGSRCSITGGYVYRGRQGNLPVGSYIYGDYCTGEILIWDGSQQILLADTTRNIVAFAEDESGEIYMIGQSGTIEKIVRARASADLDGDLKTDISVFRPSNGYWYTLNSSNNSIRQQQFGANGDIPVPEDYDGDNIVDLAIFRPSSGTWSYLRSSDPKNVVVSIVWGQNGDIPVAGDFDGDARSDLTVFRPSTGFWYTFTSSNAGFVATQFGANGDKPVAGDYDRDGKYDIAVWRPS
ncbi:MAG: PQQ-dependent sugar dehydrogenase, partial [Pyrinomonadaceae bacterium]